MIKKELLRMRRLRATPKMVQIAQKDIPQKVTVGTGAYSYQEIRREYQLFLRCCIEDDILKVALYYPDNLRAEGCLPSYEVFIDHSARRFITYDCINSKWRTAKLDRLDWPHCVPMYPRTWMSSADAKAAADYLGSEHLGYKAILRYQLQLREEALARRHRKETDPWDADMALTPALPKDWDRWVDKVGIPQNFIFYQYEKRGAKTGYCTYCGKDVPLRAKPRHNRTGRCPCCRHEITYKAVGRLGWHFDTEEVCIYLLQPRPDGFVVREFWASRRYKKDSWRTPEISCTERLRTIYDGQLDWRNYFWGNYKNTELRWIEGMPNPSWYSPQSSYYCHGNKPGRVYGKGLSQLLRRKLSGTGLERYLDGNYFFVSPDDYLFTLIDAYRKEQLSKAGLPKLTSECLNNHNTLDEVFKGGVKGGLIKSMCLDTQRLGRLRRNNGGICFLRWLRWEKEQNTVLDDKIIHTFCKWGTAPPDLSFIQDRMSPLQVYNYVRRQIKESGEDAWQVFTTWKDYLSMAKKLKMDTSDAIIYRVRLLRQRHDELVLRCKQLDKQAQAADVLKRFPKVDRICQSIKAKYEYADKEYAVIVPSGVLDILVEGDILNHCLRGSDRYWDRIQTHESYILFLRRASAPDTPYYTLEVEPDGTVRQKRTNFDRQEPDIQEAKKFLSEWQRVIAGRLTRSDRKKAAVSRVLREQEFEQMRQDNVIIYTGHLAGRRLVDVLTADLMETAA